jgi:O-antigen ligase
MIEKLLEKKYSLVVNLLIFIFPIVINLFQVAGDLVLFILAMMGIFFAISQKLSPFTIKEIKVFSYITFGYFSAVCISVIFSGQATELAHYIPRDLHFLFAPFIALALFKAEINLSYLIMGTKFALIILGISIYIQILEHFKLNGFYPSRISGVMNAGVFGNLAVSIFFITLAFFQQESFKQRILSSLALLSGLFIIIASGTRGSWFSFILLLGVYLYFFYKQKTRKSLILNIIIVLLISSVICVGALNKNVKERAYSIYTDSTSWMFGDMVPSSAGLRLEMYSLAFDKIGDVPFLGHGYRTSNVVVFENSTSPSGRLSYTFNHLHNAYLTNYFNGGFILLGALLFILFLPLRLFIEANIQNREDPIFISGVILTLGYASFGMVNILLGDTYMNGFYVFFLAIIMLLTNKSIKA